MGETIYLAGPIVGLSYPDAANWRIEVTPELVAAGYRVLDPLRAERVLALDFADRPISDTNWAGVVEDPFKRDVWDIRRCDVVLADLTLERKVSRGTSFELGMAYALGKGIVLVTTTAVDKLHPFLKGPATVVCATLEDAIEWLCLERPADAGSYTPSKVYDWGGGEA